MGGLFIDFFDAVGKPPLEGALLASDDLAANGAVDAEGVVFDLMLLADADRRRGATPHNTRRAE